MSNSLFWYVALYLDRNDATNILYRKALILKAKKCFREAFDVAVECRQKALERNNSNLVGLSVSMTISMILVFASVRAKM